MCNKPVLNELRERKPTAGSPAEYSHGHGHGHTHGLKEGQQPWTEREINWPQTIYLASCHIGAIFGLYTLCNGEYNSNKTIAWACMLHFLSGLGITGGVHRLWSHRSYTAALPFRIFLALCVQIANQGSIFHWVRDHRVHHLCSETEADPHDANQGFWFAHIGWLLVKKDPAVTAKGKTLDFSDLLQDPVVMVDKMLFPFSNIFMCFIATPLVAVYGWEEDTWAAFMICGFLRYVAVLHNTWTVNSVAHLFGDGIHETRPYDEKINPSENFWVTLLAHGEGWHNYHHSYPHDYSASEHGWMQQYNPTTFTIDAMALIGLVTDRKKATKQWEARKARKEAKATVPQEATSKIIG
jgi:stearoyl-CoA desaturase (delta-9 desaturase)